MALLSVGAPVPAWAIDPPALNAATPAQVRQFRLEQNSHRLRVSATVIELLGDRAFIAANPEFEALARQMENSARGALLHDYSKASLPDNHPIIQVLAGNRELDRRSLAPDDPRKIQLDFQVKALNELDDKVWKLAESKVGKDREVQKLLTNLVAAIDWHDTAVNRKSEFGGRDGQNLKRVWDTASDWIKKHPGIADGDRRIMLNVSDFLETNFDYNGKVSSRYTVQRVETEGFESLQRRLHQRARRADLVRVNDRQKTDAPTRERAAASTPERSAPRKSAPLHRPGLVRTPGAIGVALMAVQINSVINTDPEVFTKSTLGVAARDIFAGTKCESRPCAAFKQKCAALNLPEGKCVREEFLGKLPLHEQSRFRADPQLNVLVAQYSPKVIGLSCRHSPTATEVRIILQSGPDEAQSQTIEFNSNAQPVRAVIDAESRFGHHPTLVHFENGRPGLLQYFDDAIDRTSGERAPKYQSLPDEDWVNSRSYGYSRFLFRNKYAAIQQAQDTHRLLSSQPRSITRCCGDEECRGYFTEAQLRMPAAGSRSTAGAAR